MTVLSMIGFHRKFWPTFQTITIWYWMVLYVIARYCKVSQEPSLFWPTIHPPTMGLGTSNIKKKHPSSHFSGEGLVGQFQNTEVLRSNASETFCRTWLKFHLLHGQYFLQIKIHKYLSYWEFHLLHPKPGIGKQFCQLKDKKHIWTFA